MIFFDNKHQIFDFLYKRLRLKFPGKPLFTDLIDTDFMKQQQRKSF